MDDRLSQAIVDAIRAAGDSGFVLRSSRAVSGGCIANNLCISGGRSQYFLKLLPADRDRLDAEIDGLQALAKCSAWRVPAAIASGVAGASGFLVLEWIEMDRAAPGRGAGTRLAEALAALHAAEWPRFGWHRDNYLGATAQTNRWRDDWADFLVEHRLKPQFARSAALGLCASNEELDRIRAGLQRSAAKPRLVHGDFWSGNVGFSARQPVIFDPAVHFADAWSDIAMAELFGGFPPDFVASYRAIAPEEPGDEVWRRRVYQLYHLLNHVNLFGSVYCGQAQALFDRVVRELPA